MKLRYQHFYLYLCKLYLFYIKKTHFDVSDVFCRLFVPLHALTSLK